MGWFRHYRNLLLFEGIAFTILGFLAIALPGISTLSFELFIGWLLIFGGIVQIYRSFKSRHMSPGFWSTFVMGCLYLIFGLLLVFFPIAGVLSLTILLMTFFILEGCTKIILGFQLKSSRRWGWFILNGLLSLVMAFIIWIGWPGTAFWVLGLLVGINMLFFGMSLIFLAFDTSHQNPSNPSNDI